MRICGGRSGGRRPCPSSPRTRINSSLAMPMTVCAGESERSTSWPTARSRTAATKSLATLKLTSASSRARRTSRIASSTSCSVRRPFLPSRANVSLSRSVKVSNMDVVSNHRMAREIALAFQSLDHRVGIMFNHAQEVLGGGIRLAASQLPVADGAKREIEVARELLLCQVEFGANLFGVGNTPKALTVLRLSRADCQGPTGRWPRFLPPSWSQIGSNPSCFPSAVASRRPFPGRRGRQPVEEP